MVLDETLNNLDAYPAGIYPPDYGLQLALLPLSSDYTHKGQNEGLPANFLPVFLFDDENDEDDMSEDESFDDMDDDFDDDFDDEDEFDDDDEDDDYEDEDDDFDYEEDVDYDDFDE